jgi:hypothetical protein
MVYPPSVGGGAAVPTLVSMPILALADAGVAVIAYATTNVASNVAATSATSTASGELRPLVLVRVMCIGVLIFVHLLSPQELEAWPKSPRELAV